MTARPSISPLFATDATLGTGPEAALTPRLDPGAGVRARGLLANTRAPGRWFNSLLGVLGDWVEYLDQKFRYQFNVLNYGATGLGLANDTLAIQAAIDACHAAGGGCVWLPSGVYLHGLLTKPETVSLAGVPNKTFSLHTGSGDGFYLPVLGANQSNPSTISDIRFIGNVVGTGTHIVNSDQKAAFIRCTWNGLGPTGLDSNNLQGKLLTQANSSSRTLFIDCDIKVAGALRGLDISNGRCRVVRGTLTMPGTYDQALVYAGGSSDVALINVDVDCSAHTVSAAYVLVVPNTTARGRMLGCRVNGVVGATTYGFWWEEGALVVAQGNDWDMSAFFSPYAANQAAAGSLVDLLPTLAVDAGGATAINASVTGSRAYESELVKNTATTPTTIDLRQGIVPGQVKNFTYYNAAAGAVALSMIGSAVTASAIPGSGTLGAGNTLTGTFVWESRDVSSSYRWVQKGTWGVGATLV